MENIFDLANDRPKLSKHDLDLINNDHTGKDRALLRKAHLEGLEKMENWGMP